MIQTLACVLSQQGATVARSTNLVATSKSNLYLLHVPAGWNVLRLLACEDQDTHGLKIAVLHIHVHLHWYTHAIPSLAEFDHSP